MTHIVDIFVIIFTAVENGNIEVYQRQYEKYRVIIENTVVRCNTIKFKDLILSH